MSSPYESIEYIDRKTLEEDVISINGQLMDARLEIARLRQAAASLVEALDIASDECQEEEIAGLRRAARMAREALG